ncbi:MAG: lipopolysaccharide transport periplasmic protein LptA [Legionella sp.]|nr:MAG: lipopolysaccharide transport periplasmic protein LptA [Legionella sp.]
MHQLRVNSSLVVGLLLSNLAFALPSDKEKVMHVVADSADLNQLKRLGTYIGHVEFVQGTTNLHAAKAITKGNNKNQLSFAKAEGNKKQQAHYWTQSDPNKPPFHAYADVIHYYPLSHKIELLGNARVEQGPNSLKAAKIIYDTLAQHVITSSDQNNRTTIILYPEKKKI